MVAIQVFTLCCGIIGVDDAEEPAVKVERNVAVPMRDGVLMFMAPWTRFLTAAIMADSRRGFRESPIYPYVLRDVRRKDRILTHRPRRHRPPRRAA